MANMELIEAKTSTSSSVTFSSIPQTYTDLKLIVSARNSAGSTGVQIEFNGSASGYTNRRLFGDGSGVTSDAPSLSYISNTMIDDSGYTASTFGNGEIYIPNYTSSNYKSVSVDGVTENNATQAYSMLTAGLWSNTAAITSIKLTAESSGNFVSGSTFYLYGISNVTSGIKATGGVVSSDGTYYYHMFPFSGTFTPTEAISADYLVIAGGGGGGVGGGGAGGYRTSIGGTPLSLTATSYSVTVGAGGAPAVSGSDSIFSTITSTGGGRGSSGTTVFSGGSGGGGGNDATDFGLGNTPSTSPSQGNNGGQRANGQTSGGGGGAGGVGSNATATSPTNTGGAGGIGSNSASTWAIATQTGANNGYYAGGGGGAGAGGGTFGSSGGGEGGLGGGGNGEINGVTGRPAIINTGSGGGGGYYQNSAGTGGSGLVIIRYAI